MSLSLWLIRQVTLYIANTTPLLKDLYEYIIPQYATDWKEIGRAYLEKS